jgi:hypothetical protein
MAASSSATLVNTPQRMRSPVISPKKRSTWLSQDADRGGEMHVEAGMLGQPSLDRRVFMGGAVVSDQMQVEALGRAAVDEPQEFEPFLVTMTLHAFADHFAGGDIEGGEQRCRSMPFVDAMGRATRHVTLGAAMTSR